jgi:hypothetical protein
MSSTAANTTNDVSSKVLLFRAIVFAMTNSTAILANLILVITKSTVQGCKFPKLVAFMIVLAFRCGCCLQEHKISGQRTNIRRSPFR